MVKKYIFVGFGLVVLGLIALGIYKELDKSKKVLSTEVAEKKEIASIIPVWLKTNPELQKIQNDLNTVAEYRAKNGCIEDAPAQSPECDYYNQRNNSLRAQLLDTVHRLQIEGKSPQAVTVATADIRDLAEDLLLEVKITDIQPNPYIYNGKRVDVYSSLNGMQYLVDAATNKVVQFGPAPSPSLETTCRMTPELTHAQLKQKALTYLAKHITDFSQIKSSDNFDYTETSKDNKAWAFRWNSKTKPEGDDMAPFVQVVLSPAGDVMSFNDTRSLY